MSLFSGTFGLVEKALDASALRHKALADNIANAETPHYKRRDVSFRVELQKAQKRQSRLEAFRTDSRHIPFKTESDLSPRVVEDRHTLYLHNGNNVDMDVEMTELAKNQIMYQALIDRVNGHFKQLRTVISEVR